MRILSICLVLLLVAVAMAEMRHGEHHHQNGHNNNNNHHGEHHHNGQQHHHMGSSNQEGHCAYTSTHGFHYDLRMLETALRERDWKIYNAQSKSTFHLNPCGSVHVPGCPAGSAVCEVDEKQQAVSFGSASSHTWADGSNGHTFELTFGNGELCNNGVPRKSIVTFSCSLPTHAGPFRTHVTEIDEEKCTVNILVDSPHACPVPVFCQAIKDADVCERTEGLCGWHEGRCGVAQPSWLHKWVAKHHLSPAAFLAWVGVGSFLMSCSLALCCCACCHAMKKKRHNKAVLPIRKKSCKKAKKQTKKAQKEVEAPIASEADAFPMQELPAQGVYVYQPLQTQLQDIYTQPNVYGFHMVQVMPGQHVQFAPQ